MAELKQNKSGGWFSQVKTTIQSASHPDKFEANLKSAEIEMMLREVRTHITKTGGVQGFRFGDCEEGGRREGGSLSTWVDDEFPTLAHLMSPWQKQQIDLIGARTFYEDLAKGKKSLAQVYYELPLGFIEEDNLCWKEIRKALSEVAKNAPRPKSLVLKKDEPKKSNIGALIEERVRLAGMVLGPDHPWAGRYDSSLWGLLPDEANKAVVEQGKKAVKDAEARRDSYVKVKDRHREKFQEQFNRAVDKNHKALTEWLLTEEGMSLNAHNNKVMKQIEAQVQHLNKHYELLETKALNFIGLEASEENIQRADSVTQVIAKLKARAFYNLTQNWKFRKPPEKIGLGLFGFPAWMLFYPEDEVKHVLIGGFSVLPKEGFILNTDSLRVDLIGVGASEEEIELILKQSGM